MNESIHRYCETLTVEQLHRLHRRVTDRVYRAFAGGLSFGVDWATLHLCHPGLGVALSVILRVQRERIAPVVPREFTPDPIDAALDACDGELEL